MILLDDSEKITWTRHSKEKMRHYRLSENRLKRVLRSPDRKEIGIAPRTIAIMQRAGTKKRPTEIWLLYQLVRGSCGIAGKKKRKKLTIISAWRYPGISPVREPPPIPEDILFEISRAK